eukprot:576206_1
MMTNDTDDTDDTKCSYALEMSSMDQQFIGQQFIYDTTVSHSDDNADRMLLVSGYIQIMQHTLHIASIPLDISNLIKHFYGTKYHVHGPAPSADEFDYAVEILTPIKMLGMTHNHNTICSCISDFAKKNIIAGSQIIQMNDIFFSELIHQNDENITSKMFKEIKQKTPSCIVFRCKRTSIQKGIHLQINVTFNAITQDNRFPYHCFKKSILQSLFKNAFDNEVDVYQVYGNKLNGGVSILLFVRSEEGQRIIKGEVMVEIGKCFQDIVSEHCIVSCTQQVFERRGNRLNCGFYNVTEDDFFSHKQTLMSLLYTVKGVDNGKNAWYLVLCDPDKLDTFLEELKSPIIHLEDHGNIIFSSYGDDIPKSIEDKASNMYDFQ